jgi:hypothetical protein
LITDGLLQIFESPLYPVAEVGKTTTRVVIEKKQPEVQVELKTNGFESSSMENIETREEKDEI